MFQYITVDDLVEDYVSEVTGVSTKECHEMLNITGFTRERQRDINKILSHFYVRHMKLYGAVDNMGIPIMEAVVHNLVPEFLKMYNEFILTKGYSKKIKNYLKHRNVTRAHDFFQKALIKHNLVDKLGYFTSLAQSISANSTTSNPKVVNILNEYVAFLQAPTYQEKMAVVNSNYPQLYLEWIRDQNIHNHLNK